MAYEFKLPDLGEGLTEGEIARWLVEEGQEIAEDDPLVEIQTDKTTVEIPSPAAGKVARILVAEGEVVPVGTVLVVIGEDGRSPAAGGRLRPERGRSEPAFRACRHAGGAGARDAARPQDRAGARRRSRRGHRDRAQRSDHRGGCPRGGGCDGTRDGRRREKLRGVRRLIAEHMARAHREVPPVTWVEECDFEELDLKLLVPAALKACRALAAGVPGAERAARGRRDRLPRPLRHRGRRADRAGPGRPGRPRLRLAARSTSSPTRSRASPTQLVPATLAPEELRGSTFTVTSAGKLGGLFHTPIVNYPEVAILGIGRIAPRPVVRDGEVVVRQTGTIAVTFDHRVIDGARASEFGLAVIRRLEGPAGS